MIRKKLFYIVFVYLVIDIIHFIFIRSKPIDSLIFGSHEPFYISILKWLMITALIVLLEFEKENKFIYLGLTGIGLSFVFMFHLENPLRHVLFLFDSIGIILIGSLGLFLIYYGLKKLLNQ